METPKLSLFDRFSHSIIAKLMTILILVIMLLIPLYWISDLIAERKNRQTEVSQEIAFKWAGQQVLSGPIIAVPYQVVKEIVSAEDSKETFETFYIYLLPKKLNINSSMTPETLQRGIYKTVVYNADIALDGTFDAIDFKKLNLDRKTLDWKNAQLIIGLSDLKGLGANPTVLFNEQQIEFETNMTALNPFENNMITTIDLSNTQNTASRFQIKFNLRGSQSINFLPLAGQTTIKANGLWKNPSFNGAILADERIITDDRFEATWNIPSFNRKFPPQWAGRADRLYVIQHNYQIKPVQGDNQLQLNGSLSPSEDNQLASERDMIQINFLDEVNNYQKTTRVTKYGSLIIILTFAALFFTEIIKKQRIHLIQYLLIGFAMVLFYSLLLAISEHIGFNYAYLTAALATIILIASFVKSLTKDKRSTFTFAGILTVFYGFIFILMQLRDYSLIVGTLGIFIILAFLMFISTKINWYQYDKR